MCPETVPFLHASVETDSVQVLLMEQRNRQHFLLNLGPEWKYRRVLTCLLRPCCVIGLWRSKEFMQWVLRPCGPTCQSHWCLAKPIITFSNPQADCLPAIPATHTYIHYSGHIIKYTHLIGALCRHTIIHFSPSVDMHHLQAPSMPSIKKQ